MAWSKADVTLAERTNLTADKPCLLGSNALRSLTSSKWTTDGNHGSSTADATGYPASCASDDFDHAITKPNGSSATWYLNFLLASAGDVDALCIKNHNLSGHQLDVQIADDAAFATRLATILTKTPSSNKRLVELVLKESGDTYAQRFTGLTYLRLKVTGTSYVPQVGEVVLSRRRQLPQSWLLPVDHWRSRGSYSEFVADSGIVTRYVKYRGQRELRGSFRTRDTQLISDLSALWDTDTECGTLPWWWVDLPSSAPSDGLWLTWNQAVKVSPTVSGTDRTFEIEALEHAPNFLSAGL